MPNLEKLQPKKEDQPHFKNLEKIAEADSQKQLSEKELILELAKQKYIQGHSTVELMNKLKNYPAEIQKRFKEFISIIALSDLSEDQISEALADKDNKNEILKRVNLIKNFKQKINH